MLLFNQKRLVSALSLVTILSSAVLLGFVIPYYSASAAQVGEKSYGVNMSGGEFGSGKVPGILNSDYIYPSDAASYRYFAAKGLTLIRVPFLWERVQHQKLGPLTVADITALQSILTTAQSAGEKVILDMHNFGSYYGAPLTKNDAAAFAGAWTQLAGTFKDYPALYGYELMNEPHDLPEGESGWAYLAQAATTAIRTVDSHSWILVPGYNWQSAKNWASSNPDLSITDPSGKVLYAAHQYFDSDGSGTYAKSYSLDGAVPNTGALDLQPFIDWLHSRNALGIITEYGVPVDSQWQTVVDNFLNKLENEPSLQGATYWSAGPWWGSYPLSIEPVTNPDRPQIAVVQKYPSHAVVAVIPPPPPPPPVAGTGLTGSYFKANDLTNLAFTRVDPTVNFDFGLGSPDPQIPVDNFSIRWTGQVQPQYSETYTFYTQSDDGVRLWVNGVEIINNWTAHPNTENSGNVSLLAGQKYNITMEYYEGGYSALIKLLWSSPSQTKSVIPQSALFPQIVLALSPVPLFPSAGQSFVSYPDGLVFKFAGNPQIYMVKNGLKSPFADKSVLQLLISRHRPIVVFKQPISLQDGPVINTMPSGSIVKAQNNKTIYAIIGDEKFRFASDAEFIRDGYNFSKVLVVKQQMLDALADYEGAFVRPPGTNFKYSNDPTVYYLDGNNKKLLYSSPDVLKALNFDINRVITIPESEQYQSGGFVSLPDGAIFRGPGNGIYQMQNGTLRKFSSFQAFLSYGYSLSDVMPLAAIDIELQAKGPVIE